MNSDLCYTKERRIHLGSLLLKIVLKWKLILVFACIFAVLGYGYAKYKQTAQTVPLEEIAADAERISEETPDYEIAKENAQQDLLRYGTALQNESQYAKESLLMQLDPYHIVSTVQNYKVYAGEDMDADYLHAIGIWLSNCAVDSEITSELAEQYDTESRYIRELIKSEMQDEQDTAKDISVRIEPVPTEHEKSVGFYVKVKGENAGFTEAVAEQIAAYLQDKCALLTEQGITLETLPAVTNESVDFNVVSTQNDSRNRMLDYSEKLTRLNTAIDNLEKEKTASEANSGSAQKQYSGKKYVAAGFVGGALLMIIILLLKYVLSRTIETEDDFRSCFYMNFLGTAPLDEKERGKGLKRKIIGKLQGPYAGLTESVFCEMTGANIANAVGDKKKILVTGTIGQEEIQRLSEELLPVLKEKCPDITFTFAEDLPGNPATRSLLKTADGIVLVEKRGYTKIDAISEELEILIALQRELVGAILL